MRVAAVDCGTNSLRLLVAEADPAGRNLADLLRRTEIVRLGQGVDASGEISPEAMARALAVTAEYARECERFAVSRIRFVATSASRDARNAADFVAGVRGLIGVEPEVISGAEEARLSFVGAVRGLPGGVPAPTLVVDLGGGSTEFVLGRADASRADASRADVEAAISVDLGSVRLTERHFRADPPGAAEIAGARREVARALDEVEAVVDLRRAVRLVGVAGSVTTITAHALRLPRYDSAAVHGAHLPVDQVETACGELLAAARQERAVLPYLHPGRVDVIGAGALIWQSVVGRVRERAGIATVTTSERDILDGLAWALAEPSEPVPEVPSV